VITTMKHALHERNRPGSWVAVVPVTRLILTAAVQREFRVERVVFVDSAKLPRIRRRLGIPYRISEIKKRDPHSESFWGSSDTFAVVRHSGRPEDVKNEVIRLVRDELSLLALSQLGYAKRRHSSYPAVRGEDIGGVVDRVLIETEGERHINFSHRSVQRLSPLVLDGTWVRFQRSVFFADLLKILNGTIEVARSWKQRLRRAALLAGQSQCADDIAQAFLWNMMALETVLPQPDTRKYREALTRYGEAFLGWVGFWQVDDYETKIGVAYSKRNHLVHRGERDSISIADLLFTDDLLLNILLNLVKHIDRFRSRQDVVDFAKKVEAEHILGVKHQVRPETLQFISRKYTEEDYRRI